LRTLSRRTCLAAVALGGCAVSETVPPVLLPPRPEDELTQLRDGADPIVAGEVLDGPLLRRFYARFGFEPIWDGRERLAGALTQAVLRAADHGLDPELFHASLLRRMAMFPPLRRELLVSHAILTYCLALATGGVPLPGRKEREGLLPEPVDVTSVLAACLACADPVAAIEALAPRTAGYAALRAALKREREEGGAGPGGAGRRALLAANLERQRWLPRPLPPDRVVVNVPDQGLVLYHDDRPVFSTRVAVGEAVERKQSPELHATIEAAFLNPPWIIPPDIVEAEILPRLREDPAYLIRNRIVLLPDGKAEQAPGPSSGLGVIMFDMPNRFDVYLHDTPDKTAFDREDRRISNGCIRVERPLELASLLLGETREAIEAAVATGTTLHKPLPRPMPVFVLYETAFAAANGGIEVRPDFYGRDPGLWRRLHRVPPETVAEAAELGPSARRHLR
jgi:murein L,D-transpeptidase YcbB/YkuD